MTREQGREYGWEWFEGPPPVVGPDHRCWFCRRPTEGEGYLEMEADAWACPGCFAEVSIPLPDVKDDAAWERLADEVWAAAEAAGLNPAAICEAAEKRALAEIEREGGGGDRRTG